MEEVKEPAVAYGKNKYTIAEYLEMEEAATEKHEYYQGEIFVMSGTKVSHNIIAGNTFGSLMDKLRGTSCRPFNSDQRIHIEKNTLFTYPDISIICGDIITLNNDDWNVLNPAATDEVAFYNALEVNDSAVQVLGDETLRDIAREIADKVRANATIDWSIRESARARMMVIVKRTLTKYGYPPDKQAKAIETVLKQAELMADGLVR